MYKALITDLDGTAVPVGSEGADVTTMSKAAIKRATVAGYQVACATGREWELAEAVIRTLGFSAPCVISGGTQIVDPHTGKILWEKKLNPSDAEKVLGIYKKHASDGIIIAESLPGRPKLAAVHKLEESELFVYLLAVDESEAITITNRVNELDMVVAHLTPSWYGKGLVDIHATHKQATKEHAINVWQEINGISAAETIGMGDSGNDIPIFQASGLKVAVANATPALLELADRVIPLGETDAVAYVIDTFLLN